MRAWKRGWAVLLALAALALPSAAVNLHPGHEHAEESPGVVPQVGQKAPDVQLPGTDGKGHWLRSYRGMKNVVLAFYPQANTPGCTAEMCSLRDDMSTLTRHDVVVFGISTDRVSDNQNFAQRQGLNFVLLSDPGHQVARAFGVLQPNGMARRATFIIDKQGTIRYVDLQVQTATHGKDVQRVLASLGAN